MDHYVYCADVYCADCTRAIKIDLKARGLRPENSADETTYDSSDWPKGPFANEESDSPQHCGSGETCLDPHVFPSGYKAGKFLEEPLTSEGARYVREMHRDDPSEVTQMWVDFYGLDRVCSWCDNKLAIDAPDDAKLCAECQADTED